MGTSTSFRAPEVPRWQAFTVALQQRLPLERVRSELFNAGGDWEEALGAPAVATFAAWIAKAWETLPERMQQAERPEHVVTALAAEARRASQEEESTPGLALAERAFTTVLTEHASGAGGLCIESPQEAAQEFVRSRGETQQLVSSYLSSLLGQYARHVAAREVGRLTEGPDGMGIAETRRLVRSLAVSAEEVGRTTLDPGSNASEIRERWHLVVRDAFTRGKELPKDRG